MLKADQQGAQGPRPVKSEPNFLIQQPSHSVRSLPLSPAPRRPQQHCLACREGKQSFLMNHPAASLIAFTSWAPNLYSSRLIPPSTYSVPTRAQIPTFPVVLLMGAWNLLLSHFTPRSTSENRSSSSAPQGGLSPPSSSPSPSPPPTEASV